MPDDTSLTRPDLARSLTHLTLEPDLGIRAAVNMQDGTAIVRHIEEQIAAALVDGRSVMLSGFLKLEPVVRPERRARNPRNGEPITVPEKRVVKVRVLKSLADRVNDRHS